MNLLTSDEKFIKQKLRDENYEYFNINFKNIKVPIMPGKYLVHEYLLDSQAIEIMAQEIRTKMPMIDEDKVIQKMSPEECKSRGIFHLTLGKTQLGGGVVAKAQLIEACKGRLKYDIDLTDERDM